jgi:hypothetical protein
MKTIIACAIVVLSMSGTALSQTSYPQSQPRVKNAPDSTMVFTSPHKDKPAAIDSPAPLPRNAYGLDVMLSGNGYGAGAFFRHEYSRDLYGTVSLAISDAKDDNEIEYTDYYGQTYVPNKVNRFLMMPLFFGAEYRLFADDILDTFRPYINAGAGPTLILSAPYDLEYFNSLMHHAQAHYTAGGYVGFGAFFGSERGSLMGVNFRYYYIPLSGGVNSMINPVDNSISKKSQFGGFFITVNIGASY